MRFLKLALISAIVLFGLITAIAFLLPSHLRVSRAIDIHAPAEKIMPWLTDIHQWDSWNIYIRSYGGKQFQGQEFISKELRVAITGVTDSLVAASWQPAAGRPFESGYALVRHEPSLVTVQWYFDFHLRWYPWEKFQGIIYDRQMGPDMEASLQQLKGQAEKNP